MVLTADHTLEHNGKLGTKSHALFKLDGRGGRFVAGLPLDVERRINLARDAQRKPFKKKLRKLRYLQRNESMESLEKRIEGEFSRGQNGRRQE